MKIFYLLALFIFLITKTGQGQPNTLTSTNKKAIKAYQACLGYFERMDDSLALQLINDAIVIDSGFIEAYLLRSEIYRELHDTNHEISDYRKVIALNPDFFPYTFYNLGVALWDEGQYEFSKEMLNAFLAKNYGEEDTKTQADSYIKKCDFAIQQMNHPVEFKPIELDSNINCHFEQYWPSLSVDEKTMVFTVLLIDSTRIRIDGQFAKQEDFYYSHNVNGKWEKCEPIGPPINTPWNEGAQQLSSDGNTLVYTGCNRPDGYGKCDIYFSYFSDKRWTIPENAGHVINSSFSDKQPSLSPDGTTLYFSSNRPGGFGGMDLYYSTRDINGTWKAPINMGNKINTSGDDISPFIHPDNQTFYFSSDGHPGMGKKDIYFCRRMDDGSWSTPQDIGYPINTYRDELGLVINNLGTRAYFASDYRTGLKRISTFDVPQSARPKKVSYLSGIIYDAENLKPLSAKFQLLVPESGDTVMQATSAKDNGKYLICLPSGKSYALNVSHPGYLFYSVHFNLEDDKSVDEPYTQDIPLNRIKAGEKVILHNIFFKTDSYELLKSSNAELQKLLEFINFNPKVKFEIAGFTDNSGSTDYNLKLSDKRAKTVYDFLISKIKIPGNLSYKGYGEKEPVDSNLTENGKAKNRRTELKILRVAE